MPVSHTLLTHCIICVAVAFGVAVWCESSVNVVTFLAALILLVDGENSDCLPEKLAALFKLADFQHSGQISRDDLVSTVW